ncbi:hypothetical protein P7D43_00950 [Enterococcus avium]|uniref:Uncharacterized protein n=1 Tax=Enterococcus avium TaxID=33945 RepID=A0AAW8RRT6_ENTAV|nr:hypothetical protein [Enterococcus avium]MDT2400924.1 hypothetical protein [Enterococcus avium]
MEKLLKEILKEEKKQTKSLQSIDRKLKGFSDLSITSGDFDKIKRVTERKTGLS